MVTSSRLSVSGSLNTNKVLSAWIICLLLSDLYYNEFS